MKHPTPVIYLAAAIDQGQPANLAAAAKQLLLATGHVVFDPAAGWSVPTHANPSATLQKANFALLDQCDGLLAILTPDIMTVGTILEIDYARRQGLAVAVCGPQIRASWALAYLGITPHTHLRDAIGYMKGQFDD